MDNNNYKTSVKHFFDVKLAETIGIIPAILYENILFWVQKNEANNKHFHDGLFWTYNSTRAFSKLFPYLSEDQISRALKKLEDCNLIVKGNYNETKYDRTTWYSIPQKSEMDSADLQNGSREIAEPIPYINQITKPDENKSIEPTIEPKVEKINFKIQEFFQEFWKAKYDMPCKINLFTINEIAVYCNQDYELFLKVVDKYLKDAFWGSKALSPELLLKSWHTLGNVNKVEDWKRLGFESEKAYLKSNHLSIGSTYQEKKEEDDPVDFVKALKNIKRIKNNEL